MTQSKLEQRNELLVVKLINLIADLYYSDRENDIGRVEHTIRQMDSSNRFITIAIEASRNVFEKIDLSIYLRASYPTGQHVYPSVNRTFTSKTTPSFTSQDLNIAADEINTLILSYEQTNKFPFELTSMRKRIPSLIAEEGDFLLFEDGDQIELEI